MKYLKLLLFAILLASCGGSENANTTVQETKAQETQVQETSAREVPDWKQEMAEEERIRQETILEQQELFQTGKKEMNAIIDLIDRKGIAIYGGTAKQFTFDDSNGSRHSVIKSDKFEMITVYGYKNGIKTNEDDTENFFSYDIYEDGVYYIKGYYPIPEDETPYVVRGYKELLAKTMK